MQYRAWQFRASQHRRLQVAVGLVVFAGCVFNAHAVVTVTPGYNGQLTLIMRVGTPTAGVVDTVQFNVVNPTVGNSLTSAPSVSGNGVAIAASSGGVPISVIMRIPNNANNRRFQMTVSSDAALTCVSVGCGTTTIPFSTISWIATPTPSGTNSAIDFQSGTFVGGSTQSMNTFSTNQPVFRDAITDISSTLTFSYSNVTAYLAGNYSGRVTYTATLP